VLHLHRAERADRLALALGEVLLDPPADPFAAEVIAVPAKGVERWLGQRLSTVLGVSANMLFPSPDQLVRQAVESATESAAETASIRRPARDEDPWAPGRVLWTLLDVVDECVREPWCGVLAAHLGVGEDRGRRWATASLLTRLFTAYGAERPRMLLDWSRKHDGDGAGGDLPEHLRWQAELWRRLRAAIGSESPAERLDQVCARLRDDPGRSDLPPRFSIFGPTRLTREQLLVVDALAAHRDVHLWLAHPSPAMWDWLANAPIADPGATTRRDDDLTALAVRNPLLGGLGRDVRELQQRLRPLLVGGTDTHHPASAGDQGTLLGQVQAAIRDDRAPQRSASADASLQVHAGHGPARQVEILREALLHAFTDLPDLQPRDVLVMCPDVETYAPLIRAAFGQGSAAGPDGHPGHRLRVRLADRSLARTNPLLDTVATLLGLAGDRVTASRVLDLAGSAPVRRRFGFDDDELEQLRVWTARSGVRWGLSARDRRAYGLDRIAQGTWPAGLDRVLLGVAADETALQWLDRALPLDDVDSTDVDLAGRFTELLDRLWSVLAALNRPHRPGRADLTQPASAWAAHLDRALTLLTDVPDSEAWQLTQARRELAEAVEHASAAPLALADVRAMLAERLAGRPTRANFRTGELTVATLVPMRSVPHRVVALLGLDDDVFPRGAGVDGDDVLAVTPGIGERDRRSEDRQLLLDAVMAAGERLIVLYTGADPVTGAPRPPAVPLGELLDVVTATCGTDVVRRHPLQPFAPRNVDAGAPFSHDVTALRGARAAVGARQPDPPLLAAPLPPLRETAVALADLVAFAQHPVQAFLAQRLGVRVPGEETPLLDDLAADLDGLARWDIGERMLTSRLAGVDARAFAGAELRRGTLPPLRLGAAVLAGLEPGVDALVRACAPVVAAPATTVDVDLDLGDGRRLSGTVTGVHDTVLAASSYSTLAPKHRIAAWVRLLAVAATHPGRPWSALTTGRGPFRQPVRRSCLRPPADPLTVLTMLCDLVRLRDLGLCEPLPLGPGSAAVYADRRATGSSPAEAAAAAAGEWEGRFGDRTDRHLIHVHGRASRFESLLAAPPVPGEGSHDEPTRFGVLSRRLWAPLLENETLGTP
jgi:exodeoxyribonuclease V gamma subunit